MDWIIISIVVIGVVIGQAMRTATKTVIQSPKAHEAAGRIAASALKTYFRGS